MSKLSLDNLGRRFGAVDAVRGVTLALREGEFVSLLGPSGCGKTTTLRMIAGFMDPTEGTIALDGQVVSAPGRSLAPERRGMSMIFQSYAIWPNMTVAENVAFGLKLRRLPADEVARRVNAMLALVRLDRLADRYPSELSGGQQQRVALARAIVIEPAVLLLDEPLSNLDAALREEMRAEIRRLHDRFRITTVYVTHDQTEAMVTSDRIVVMNHGRIEQVDDPVTLYTRPRTRFVAGFIGRTNILDGTADGARIAFDGFDAPAEDGARGPVCVSVRPEAIAIAPARGDSPGWWVRAVVAERAYLGDHWDYLFALDGTEARLRVTAPPATALARGEAAWLRIDAAQAVRLPPEEATDG